MVFIIASHRKIVNHHFEVTTKIVELSAALCTLLKNMRCKEKALTAWHGCCIINLVIVKKNALHYEGGRANVKNLEISLLLDFYGDILTEKQKEVIELYYDEDLSLSEIASHEGITRQGVRDSIKRGEVVLLDMEARLGLAKKFREMQGSLSKIVQCAKDIEFYNREYHYSGQIAEKASVIISLAAALNE